MGHDIASPALAKAGRDRTEWAGQSMPVLRSIAERFARERPLEGRTVAGCMHVTTETANLVAALVAGGARVSLCASNPLSKQDDVAAHLVSHLGVEVYAVRGEDNDRYYEHIRAALRSRPSITLDDGADLVSTVNRERTDLIDGLLGDRKSVV